MRLRLRQFAVLPALLAGAPALADESNFRPYVVGGRAAGMGGAFTALADDGSGPYYNPGGLAFVDRSMLSLSAAVYGLVRGSQQDALGAGHDLNYSDLNIFPVSTSAILKYGSTDTPDGAPANALALSVFVPDGLLLDDRDSLAGNNQNAVFFSQQEQTIWVGGAYARRLGRLGIGASAFLLIGTSTSFADLTAILSPTNFATLTVRTDSTVVGAVGAVGIRYDVTDQLRIGFSVFSPELGIYGSRRTFLRAVAPPNQVAPVPPAQISVVNQDGLHASPSLPFRLQGGVAWVSGKLTLAADAVYLGARQTDDDAGTQFERRVVRNAVVNGAVGAEYLLGDAFPLRAGFFTDFAASPNPQAFLQTPGAVNPNTDNTSHLDRYGGTLSIGYRTEHTATDLGLILSYATGQDLQANNFDFSNLVPTRSTQTLLYVFLASSYRF